MAAEIIKVMKQLYLIAKEKTMMPFRPYVVEANCAHSIIDMRFVMQ